MIKKALKWSIIAIGTLSTCFVMLTIMAVATDTEDKSIHQQTDAEEPNTIKTELERMKEKQKFYSKQNKPLIFEGEYNLDFLEEYNKD